MGMLQVMCSFTVSMNRNNRVGQPQILPDKDALQVSRAVCTSCMDARDFVRLLCQSDVAQPPGFAEVCRGIIEGEAW